MKNRGYRYLLFIINNNGYSYYNADPYRYCKRIDFLIL